MSEQRFSHVTDTDHITPEAGLALANEWWRCMRALFVIGRWTRSKMPEGVGFPFLRGVCVCVDSFNHRGFLTPSIFAVDYFLSRRWLVHGVLISALAKRQI